MKPLSGLHHVTAIAGDPQQNVAFYNGLLGLRLVKKTVNFDDPSSYHLYYGDSIGSPGTLITFFVWPGAASGKTGVGEPVSVAFEIPAGSLAWWTQRFRNTGVPIRKQFEVFGAPALVIADPDGMEIELVETSAPRATQFWPQGGIPLDHAITRIRSVTLSIRDQARSGALFTGELGFSGPIAEDGRSRFQVGTGAAAGFIDIATPDLAVRGRQGAGSIHHLAFRTPDDENQENWLNKITGLGLHASPVMDRKYFRSIYFREPGGVLFEIATDLPGFAVDESADHLGEQLTLPAQYEPLRSRISVLPAISTSPILSEVQHS